MKTQITSIYIFYARIRNIQRFYIVADRGMISAENLNCIEGENAIFYILGARMRKGKEVREQLLTCGGRLTKFTRLDPRPRIPRPSR